MVSITVIVCLLFYLLDIPPFYKLLSIFFPHIEKLVLFSMIYTCFLSISYSLLHLFMILGDFLERLQVLFTDFKTFSKVCSNVGIALQLRFLLVLKNLSRVFSHFQKRFSLVYKYFVIYCCFSVNSHWFLSLCYIVHIPLFHYFTDFYIQLSGLFPLIQSDSHLYSLYLVYISADFHQIASASNIVLQCGYSCL